MLIRKPDNWVLTVIVLFTGILLPHSQLFSQDTLPQGVIKVRRTTVPSDYYVRMSYDYHFKKRGGIFHLFGPRTDGMIMSPPDPVTLDQHANDSNQTMLDSSFMITFYDRLGKPGEEFAWIDWLNQYEHTFEWDDTSGVDSTSFSFEINSRGQMRLKSSSYDGDSSAIALHKNLLPLMKKLWIWYPAAMVSDDNRKQKKLSCTVTVQVFAVKEGYDRKLPLEIAD